jgi:hypothetical protein
MLRHSWLGLFLVLSAVAAPAHGQDQLRWKFKQGDKFWLKSETHLKQTATVEDKDVVPVEIETTTLASYTVEKVESDGSVTLEQKIESMKIKANDKLGGLDKAADKFKGATFTIKLDAKGKVTDFKGFDELMKRLSADPEFGKKLQGVLTKENMSKAAEEAFSFLPDKAVKEGEKWSRELTVPLGPLGSFDVKNTYTHKGKTKTGPVQIDLESVMTYKPPAADKPETGLSFKVTGGTLKSKDATGKILFDADKGRLVSYKSTVTIVGTLTIESNGKSITLDFKQDQNTDVSLLDKPPAE